LAEAAGVSENEIAGDQVLGISAIAVIDCGAHAILSNDHLSALAELGLIIVALSDAALSRKLGLHKSLRNAASAGCLVAQACIRSELECSTDSIVGPAAAANQHGLLCYWVSCVGALASLLLVGDCAREHWDLALILSLGDAALG